MEEEEVKLLRAVFDRYDEYSKGYLTCKQFMKLMLRLSLINEDIKNLDIDILESIYTFLDTNHDNHLSFYEFVIWWNAEDRYSFFQDRKRELMIKGYRLYRKYCPQGSMNYAQFNQMMEEIGYGYDEYTFDELGEITDTGELSFYDFMIWLDWM